MKVLLLDTSFAAYPIHEYLVSTGSEVWTIGRRENDLLALAYPDYWINKDYSNIDEVRDIIEKERFDAVIPGCTDVSMKTYSMIGIQPYYIYPEYVDDTLNNKMKFRSLCKELNLPSPKILDLDRLPKNKRYICKPVDSFSGLGVMVVESSDSADEALNYAKSNSPTKQVVCEEFIEGELFSYSGFLENGKVVTYYIVKEGSRYDAFSVDTSYMVDNFNIGYVLQLQNASESISNRLQLSNGLLHIQFIKNNEGIFIIEATRRCPGDLYSKLIEYSIGHEYAAKYASYFVGQSIVNNCYQRRYVLRHTIKQIPKNYFHGMRVDHLQGIFNIIPTQRPGENSGVLNVMRTGIAFCDLINYNSLEKEYNKITRK